MIKTMYFMLITVINQHKNAMKKIQPLFYVCCEYVDACVGWVNGALSCTMYVLVKVRGQS